MKSKAWINLASIALAMYGLQKLPVPMSKELCNVLKLALMK